MLFNLRNLGKTLNTLFVRKRRDLNLLLSLDKENGADSAQSMTGTGEGGEGTQFVCVWTQFFRKLIWQK